MTGKAATACVGFFVKDDRFPACRRCHKCRAHLAYIYDGAPKPRYVPPSQCPRRSVALAYAQALSKRVSGNRSLALAKALKLTFDTDNDADFKHRT